MLRALEIKENRFMVKELPQIIITSYLLHWIIVFPCDWKASSMILIKWYTFSRPPVFHVKCRSQNYIKSLLNEKVKTQEVCRLYQVTPSTVSLSHGKFWSWAWVFFSLHMWPWNLLYCYFLILFIHYSL